MMTRRVAVALALLIAAGNSLTCGTTEVILEIEEVEDYDGDAYTYFDGDCDDEDGAIYPGADESCNSKDDDCDGEIDEDVEISYYIDGDGDGYGEATEYIGGCTLDAGTTDNGDDCDDTDSSIYPDATETCDGVDNDCDDEIDTDASTDVQYDYYLDDDGDGYGDVDSPYYTCDTEAPSGYVDDQSDCDDTAEEINPDATETCDGEDDDCDGESDEGFDEDGSGVADCFEEYCNGVDDDGDSICDEGWDEDEDGYTSCGIPCDDVSYELPDDCDVDDDVDEDGILTCSYDCDDSDAEINPGAVEICDADNIDEDCNGDADEDDSGIDLDSQILLYPDDDGDSQGDLYDDGSYFCDEQDGYVVDNSDCDDDRAWIYAGGTELCNGRDDDCDGTTDEAAGNTYYRDADGDGFGDASITQQSCTQPDDYILISGDCDDTSADIYPGATETCNETDDDCDGEADDGVETNACGGCGDVDEETCDGEDNDCDGETDEGLETTTYYTDADEDGYGDPDDTTESCGDVDGVAENGDDCDDSDAEIYPDADETCNDTDDDCDDSADEGLDTETWYRDRDGDGFGDADVSVDDCAQPSGYVATTGDCDDADMNTYDGATELCDGDDNDCDDDIDENAGETWYYDSDGDGFGLESITTTSCDTPGAWSSAAGDCDDSDAASYPGATETCDYADNDCDGEDDDGVTNDCGDCGAVPEETCNETDDDCDGETDEGVTTILYVDADGDGYGLAGDSAEACETTSGFATLSGDCDDDSEDNYPGATEICDEADNDCDDDTDEGLDTSTYYADDDGDGYGDANNTQSSCSKPDGTVTNLLDCDDTEPLSYPGNTELCDGLDNDCDDAIDEDTTTYYADADGDGFGDPDTSRSGCSQPDGYVTNAQDCDDTQATAYYGADEICDGVDNDCDGDADETSLTYYRDSDGDGFGDPDTSTDSCEGVNGYVSNSSDCDDTSATVYEGATEACDGKDNDCDSAIDEEAQTYYQDYDGDGFGDASNTVIDCSQPNGYVGNSVDCDDTDGTTYPDATEVCDDEDNDCDSTTDEDAGDTWYIDSDSDGYGDSETSQVACDQPSGYVQLTGDCDDSSSLAKPGGTETCDDIDNDCDGEVDDGLSTSIYYKDGDEDNYGDPSNTVEDCSLPEGYVTNNDDCDDTTNQISPDDSETCNDIDDDCDTDIDEGKTTTYFVDSDNDGYGVSGETAELCELTTGYAESSGDCQPGNPLINPAATEVCDFDDNDCDNSTDEGYDKIYWYLDGDGDGYGSDTKTNSTFCQAPQGYVANSDDCDDDADDRNPGYDETCDSVDNDCDGSTDEGACSCDWRVEWTSVYLNATDSNDNPCAYYYARYNGQEWQTPTNDDDYCWGEGTIYPYQQIASGTVEHGQTARISIEIESCSDDDGSTSSAGGSDCKAALKTISYTCNDDASGTTTYTFSSHPNAGSVSTKFTFTYYEDTEKE